MKLRCLVCGEVLKSKFRHDFQKCHCENEAFIDGGNDYVHAGARDLEKIEFIEEEE